MQRVDPIDPTLKPALGLRGGQEGGGAPAGLVGALELAGWKVEEVHDLRARVHPRTPSDERCGQTKGTDTCAMPESIAFAMEQLRQTKADVQRARQQLTQLQYRHYHYKVRNMRWVLGPRNYRF